MKALILNSGLGHRMGVITKEHPKCMTEISYKNTILSRQLRMLASFGIEEVVMTTGYMDNKIIEKPKSIEEARNNLKMASGKTTLVITGICLINQEKNEIIKTFQESKVIMNTISDEDIDFYINNEPDIMYASGFIIETVASNFINKIDGSFYNILGVPVEKICENLLKWDIHLKDLD